MAIENFRRVPDNYCVYAMVCRDGDGPIYVKFGHSGSIMARLGQLRVSCPIPAKWFAYIYVGSKERARGLEKDLHKRFLDRRVTGEWFKFDLDSLEDKKEFNEGSSEAISRSLGRAFKGWWKKISVKALDQYNKEKRAQFLKSKHRKKIERSQRNKTKQIQAWKELGSYGT